MKHCVSDLGGTKQCGRSRQRLYGLAYCIAYALCFACSPQVLWYDVTMMQKRTPSYKILGCMLRLPVQSLSLCFWNEACGLVRPLRAVFWLIVCVANIADVLRNTSAISQHVCDHAVSYLELSSLYLNFVTEASL
jgi:hypothetical protein